MSGQVRGMVHADLFDAPTDLRFDGIGIEFDALRTRERCQAGEGVIVAATGAEAVEPQNLIVEHIQRYTGADVRAVALEVDGEIAVRLDGYQLDIVYRSVQRPGIQVQAFRDPASGRPGQQGIEHMLARPEGKDVTQESSQCQHD